MSAWSAIGSNATVGTPAAARNLALIGYEQGQPYDLVDEETGAVTGTVRLHKTSLDANSLATYLHDFANPPVRYRAIGRGRVVLDPEA